MLAIANPLPGMAARFLGEEDDRGAHSALAELGSLAFQRVGTHTTHKYKAFRPDFGDVSATIGKRATCYTRKWGRIPPTGKNSLRTGRVSKKYLKPNEVHLGSGSEGIL